MFKRYKSTKGITLVALVITIIILLILAGISISTLTNTGIFEKAKEAKQKSENAQKEEDRLISEYEKEIPKIDWWTASEYEDWIATQKTELEALIGTGDGWYDGQGVFHEWTQDSVNAQIAEYEKILDEIKSGTLYSKDNDEGIGYAQIPPNEKDIISVYGMDFERSDGTSLHIGDFSTQEELEEAVEKAVAKGQITKAEANSVSYQ